MEATRPDADGVDEGIRAPLQEPGKRVLRRSTEDRVVLGVAGGIGRYLDVDPVIVRVAFVLLTIFGGSGVLLYLVAALAIPEQQPLDDVSSDAGRPGNDQVALVLGAGLVVLGSLSLFGQLLPAFRNFVGPVLLLAAGVLVILWGGRR